MSDKVQCSSCGRMVEFLVDNGVCESCYGKDEK